MLNIQIMQKLCFKPPPKMQATPDCETLNR